MPSTSPAQRKLMAIASHTPGGYGGVPQSVGQEFHNADKGKYGHKPDDNKRKIAKALIKRKT